MLDTSSWGIFKSDDGYRHVAPMEDSRKHVMSAGCWCLPVVDVEDNVVLHFTEREG